ncbi:ethanolamine kinase 1-like [Anneissia japonica]|uniref:ethanolamine kinase 1-like n=1 Tax=Anneissia japonica TaxID=1529436 RepID=UPI0014257936|nr:ethanolamine kinase 1-like [Anneissia japonica]
MAQNIEVDGSGPVPKIDFAVREAFQKEDCLTLMSILRPNWPQNNIQFKIFTSGITNKLIGCYLPEDKKTMVLVRIYGHKSEVVIDREREIKTFQILFAANCGPELYAILKNGLCYGYIPGVTLSVKTVRDEHISKLIAREMVRMHCIQLSGALPEPSLFRVLRKWLNTLPEKFEDPKKNEKYKKMIPSADQLTEEINLLEATLTKRENNVVFTHNDLLLENILYDAEKDKVSFIDYEYASHNYQAYEIADHFCEYAGIDVVDYGLYPDKEFQLRWLREYLTCWNKAKTVNEPVTDEQIEYFYATVNKFALASHMFWGIWGIIQSYNSVIDFDFLE